MTLASDKIEPPKWMDKVDGISNVPFQGKPITDAKTGKIAFIYPYAKSDTSGSAWILWQDENGDIKVIMSRNQLNPNMWMVSAAGYANVLPNAYQASEKEPFIYKADDKEIRLDFNNLQLTEAMKKVVVEILKDNNGVYDKVKFNPEIVREKLANHGIKFPKDLDINWSENVIREAYEELTVEFSKAKYPQMKRVHLEVDDTPSFSSGDNARRSQNRCYTELIYLGKLTKDQEPQIKAGDDTVDAQVAYLKDLKEKNGMVYYPGSEIQKDSTGKLAKTGKTIDIEMSNPNRINLERALKQLENIIVQEATAVKNPMLNRIVKGKRKVKDLLAEAIADTKNLGSDLTMFIEKYKKAGANQLRSRIGEEGQKHFNQVKTFVEYMAAVNAQKKPFSIVELNESLKDHKTQNRNIIIGCCVTAAVLLALAAYFKGSVMKKFLLEKMFGASNKAADILATADLNPELAVKVLPTTSLSR